MITLKNFAKVVQPLLLTDIVGFCAANNITSTLH